MLQVHKNDPFIAKHVLFPHTVLPHASRNQLFTHWQRRSGLKSEKVIPGRDFCGCWLTFLTREAAHEPGNWCPWHDSRFCCARAPSSLAHADGCPSKCKAVCTNRLLMTMASSYRSQMCEPKSDCHFHNLESAYYPPILSFTSMMVVR